MRVYLTIQIKNKELKLFRDTILFLKPIDIGSGQERNLCLWIRRRIINRRRRWKWKNLKEEEKKKKTKKKKWELDLELWNDMNRENSQHLGQNLLLQKKMTNAKAKSLKKSDIIYIGPFNGLDEIIQIKTSLDFDTWLHQNCPLIGWFDAPTLRSLISV